MQRRPMDVVFLMISSILVELGAFQFTESEKKCLEHSAIRTKLGWALLYRNKLYWVDVGWMDGWMLDGWRKRN